MPAFERWIVDCGTEARAMLLGSEGLRTEGARGGWTTGAAMGISSDPVLPALARRAHEMDGGRGRGAGGRLVEEMADQLHRQGSPSSSSPKERAEAIYLDLATRAEEAAREVAALEARLSSSSSAAAAAAASSSRRKRRRKGGQTRERIRIEDPGGGEEDGPGGGKGGGGKGGGALSLVYERRARPGAGAGAGGSGHPGSGSSSPKPFVVRINREHYAKLRKMFDRVHPPPPPHSSSSSSASSSSSRTVAFHHLVFCLLVRHSSYAGGQLLNDLRGGGMQGSIHGRAFAFLERWCGGGGGGRGGASSSSLPGHFLAGECFASPLNCNLGPFRYWSGFSGDLDRHFGSRGDFFDWDGGGGGGYEDGGEDEDKRGGRGRGPWYEANPPFAPALMAEMVAAMERHLVRAGERGSALSFAVVVPSCRGSEDDEDEDGGGGGARQPRARAYAAESFRAMLQSRHLSHHIVLGAGEHGYVEGAQHLRPTRYKSSRYDTSVLLLQSARAREDCRKHRGQDWQVRFEEGIREAFRSEHEAEVLARGE